MIKEYIRALVLTFFAELGDKTQIIAMTFATQYRLVEVIFGVILGVLLNHGLAIILGQFILNFISLNKIQLLSGVIFIVFAYFSLAIEEEEEDNNISSYGPIITVALAFFLGELGDKTQIMAMTLSTDSISPIITLLGTTTGMVLTSMLGILVGSKIGGKIPDSLLKILSSIVFMFFASIKIFSLLGRTAIPYLTFALFLELLLIVRFCKKVTVSKMTPMKKAASKLYEETKIIEDSINNICLGEEVCGTCRGSSCLIGYVKNVLSEARSNGEFKLTDFQKLDDFIKKDYDEDKIFQALSLIVVNTIKKEWPHEEEFVVNQIRNILEEYLFSQKIILTDNINYYIDQIRFIDKVMANRMEKVIKGIK